jgi:RNA polymerase sigma-70 factor (ECF subfamily)
LDTPGSEKSHAFSRLLSSGAERVIRGGAVKDESIVDDEELLAAVRRATPGDTRPFEQLVERHRRRVLANCRYLSGAPDEAEDLAQDVFVKAYFGLTRFEGRSGFATWLQRIKINHCLNFLRARKGRTFIHLEDPALESDSALRVPPQADVVVATREDRHAIRTILDCLPDTLRVPLIMRDVDGLSYEEIAGILELTLSAVKMRIKRGREEFRRQYDRRMRVAPAHGRPGRE